MVEGEKMSKSKGNIYYVEDLLRDGYTADEIRFFLIYGHYRKKLNYTQGNIESATEKLRDLRRKVKRIGRKAERSKVDGEILKRVKGGFEKEMDDDLNVEKAFDQLYEFIDGIKLETLKREEASGLIKGLEEVDHVLKVLL
jgi:cysteinyl-tRNA synthetase